jgi:hypothetical protein
MLIPNAENAVIDIRKLRDYCLNSEHSTGKHKAQLFQSMLGMTGDNAPQLRQILLEVIQNSSCEVRTKRLFWTALYFRFYVGMAK